MSPATPLLIRVSSENYLQDLLSKYLYYAHLLVNRSLTNHYGVSMLSIHYIALKSVIALIIVCYLAYKVSYASKL